MAKFVLRLSQTVTVTNVVDVEVDADNLQEAKDKLNEALWGDDDAACDFQSHLDCMATEADADDDGWEFATSVEPGTPIRGLPSTPVMLE